MAKKLCICVKCGKQFDRNTEQAVRVGARRYGHASCYPESTDFVEMEAPKSKEDPALSTLKDYIKKIYGEKANWVLIQKQIKRFHNELGYSYSGIQKSLTWFYEVKGNNPEKSNGGIGIVEYCYQDSYNYYLALFLAQEANKNISKEEFSPEIKEFTFKINHNKTVKKLFKFLDEEEVDDNE